MLAMSTGWKFPVEEREWVHKPGQFGPAYSHAPEKNKGPILEVLKKYMARGSPSLRKQQQKRFHILEVSSGSGQHIGHFFEAFSSVCSCVWQPSDCTTALFSSIFHYAELAQQNLAREASQSGQQSGYKSWVLEPVVMDASIQPWVVDPANMSYWEEPLKCITNFAAGSGGLDTGEDPGATVEAEEKYHFDVVFNANMIHITPYKCCEGLFAGVGKVLKVGGILFLYGPFNISGQYTSRSNRNFDLYLKSLDESYGIRNLETLESLAHDASLALVERVPMPSNNFCLVFEKR